MRKSISKPVHHLKRLFKAMMERPKGEEQVNFCAEIEPIKIER